MNFLRTGKVQVVVVIFVLIIVFTAKKCRELYDDEQAIHKTRPQQYNCFDMKTGSAACIARNVLKSYYLTKYNLEPEQRNKPEVPFVSKYNMAPYVGSGWDMLESLYSRQRPKGEAISKAIGAFIGDHVGSYVAEKHVGGGPGVAENVGAWNKGRLAFMSGSLLGAYLGGEVGVMAYDIYDGFDHLCNYLFHHQGEKSPSSNHQEL
ncbi:uncharacterized protein LOC111313050 [Durio zibethinus]|uniref:Uncharacterized protein LOC111313050 n=1 Tax=Durio zibethinus TaxID=66656 RepID=A0A6P6AXK3_DURZI|nr:uncharacterized protein LOC111313050 [Durio zibethinus]